MSGAGLEKQIRQGGSLPLCLYKTAFELVPLTLWKIGPSFRATRVERSMLDQS